MMLVTVEAASQHVRRDTTEDDADFTSIVMAASSAVMNYLEQTGESWGDSAGDPIEDSNGVAMNVPYAVQAATKMMVGYLYSERYGSNEHTTQVQGFYLPIGVTALLYPYRTPTAL